MKVKKIEERIQKVLDERTQDKEDPLPGISAAIKLNGDEPLTVVSGYSRYPDESDFVGIPIDKNMTFEYCSTTKTFTAALMVRDAVRGRIGLDQNMFKWLPLFSDSPRIDGYITVRQLLRMTAGLADIDSTMGVGMDYDKANDRKAETPQEKAIYHMFAEVGMDWFYYNEAMRAGNLDYGVSQDLNSPHKTWSPMTALSYLGRPLFRPDAGWRYTNSNYVLLGVILQNLNNTMDIAFAYRKIALENGLFSIRTGADFDSECQLNFIRDSLGLLGRVDYDNFWMFSVLLATLRRVNPDFGDDLTPFSEEMANKLARGLKLASGKMVSEEEGVTKETAFRFDLSLLTKANANQGERRGKDMRNYFRMYVAMFYTALHMEGPALRDNLQQLKDCLMDALDWLEGSTAYGLEIGEDLLEEPILEVDPEWSLEQAMIETIQVAMKTDPLITFCRGKMNGDDTAPVVMVQILKEVCGLIDCTIELSRATDACREDKQPKAIPHDRKQHGKEFKTAREAFMTSYTAAGFLMGTARDLATWFYHLYSPSHPDPEMNEVGRIMRCTEPNPDGFANMHDFGDKPYDLAPNVDWTGYGLGVQRYEVTLRSGEKTCLYGHAGGSSGYNTMGLWWEKRDLSFSFLINKRGTREQYGALVRDITQALEDAANAGEL